MVSCYAPNISHIYHSQLAHLSTCGTCQGVYLGAHVIIQGGTRCEVCKAMVNVGSIIKPNMINIYKISANGSVILQNGVVILNSKDINAYFNNELAFYAYIGEEVV